MSGRQQALTTFFNRIVYQLLSTRQSYDESNFAKLEQGARLRREAKLKAQAKAVGFDLVPAQTQHP